MFVYITVCVCVYITLYVCVYNCIYIHIYITVFSDSFIVFQMPAPYDVYNKSAVMQNGKLVHSLKANRRPTKAAIYYAMLYPCDELCYMIQQFGMPLDT